MHEMSVTEAYICIDNLTYIDKLERELMRYSICATYNSNPFLKKQVKLEEVMELPWDKKHVYSLEEAKLLGDFNQDDVVTEKEIERAKEKIKAMEELISSGKEQKVEVLKFGGR